MNENQKKDYKITIKYNEDKQETCEKLLELMLNFIVESNLLDKNIKESDS